MPLKVTVPVIIGIGLLPRPFWNVTVKVGPLGSLATRTLPAPPTVVSAPSAFWTSRAEASTGRTAVLSDSLLPIDPSPFASKNTVRRNEPAAGETVNFCTSLTAPPTFPETVRTTRTCVLTATGAGVVMRGATPETSASAVSLLLSKPAWVIV